MISNKQSNEEFKDIKDQNQLIKEILDLNIDIDKNTLEFCISKYKVYSFNYFNKVIYF